MDVDDVDDFDDELEFNDDNDEVFYEEPTPLQEEPIATSSKTGTGYRVNANCLLNMFTLLCYGRCC